MNSRTEIDEAAVKKYNEEAKDWSAYCKVCNRDITGTLSEIRSHIAKCHGKQSQ